VGHKNPRLTDDADPAVKEIKRQTRRRYSAEEKIQIVLAGLRGESSIAELCRQEGIVQSQYYAWSKELLEADMLRHHLGDDAVQVTRAAYQPMADPFYQTFGPKTRREFLNLMKWTDGDAA